MMNQFLSLGCTQPDVRRAWRLFLGLLLTLSLLRPAHAQTGLVAAYGFNEGSGTTVTDLSGNGNNGTITGAAWDASGKFGSALQFNGTSNMVTIPDSASVRLSTAMTLEAWVQPSALGTVWRTVILKEQTGGLIYSLYANTDTTRPSANAFVTAENETRGTAAVSTTAWTHLAATYDGAALRLYVNGTQASSLALTGSIKSSTGALRIGGNNIWGEWFKGLIDEVRIYNRALSAAEIQTDMTTPVGSTPPPPDTTPPTVSIAAPANGATISGTVTVFANASDNIAVAGVQFLLDGAAIGTEDTTSPYSISWNSTTAANGAHTLSARARDAAGNQTTSAVINVTVSNAPPDTTPPTVSMIVPANGATVSGMVTVSASASDNVGVVGVQFLLDGAALNAEVTTAPYSISWNSATALNGPHTLSARARDAAGNQTTSTVVNVSVTGGITTSGLVAAYGFNEGSGATVSDVSGNGNNGTITGAAWNASGKFGSALLFNGTSNLVTINDSTSLHLSSAMTAEAWVNPAILGSGWRTVVLKEQTGELIFSLYGNTDTTRPSGNVFITAENETRGTAALTLNTWTHLAVTYDGANLRLFVNGTQVSSKAVTGAIKSSTGALRIGGNNIWGEYFSGLIDEVRIYNRALSAAEIQTDMNTPVGTTPPPDTTPPTVSMAAPADGSTATGMVTVSASASDNVGVVGVQFLLDGAPLGTEDTTSPYSISWNSTAATNGAHTLSARARDAAGNQTTSTVVNVTVSNAAPDTVPPTVVMTIPSDGATVSGNVGVWANASDNVGVVGVQFLLDGSPIGAEDTTASYWITWNSTTTTNGTHLLSARARDAAGNQTTSAPITVTVSNTIDTTPPTVSMTAPADGSTATGTVTVSANASDNVGVVGVQFLLDGAALGTEVTTAPYSISWNSAVVSNGLHTLTARARDAAGNQTTSAGVSVTVTGGVSMSGLVAAYGFNEGSGSTVGDASGNSNNGTLNNATWNNSGKFGAAIAFDGTKSRVDIPDTASLHLTTGMTLEAWVQPTALSSWRTVLLKEQPGGLVYAMYANTDTNRPSGHVFVNSEVNTRGTAQVATNVWTHLATTYDGSVLRLYVNGTLVNSLTVGGNIMVSAGALRIGGNAIWGEYFSGLIDEVRVYNRALSSSEIQTDMATPVTNATPPPPDTTPPTVSVTAPALGTTISGLTTLYASASDNVGVVGVQFYVDGQPFGSEITAQPYTAKWNTSAVTNASHTITAIARDAAGYHTTSSSVNVTVSNTNDPSIVGAWSAPFDWPIVAINMVVTTAGDVISWDGPPSNGGTSALSWSPSSGVFTPIPNNLTNMFCNAGVVLADGRVLAIGGHADYGVGLKDSDIYDPVTKQWSRTASMNYARWYPTATVLPDGRVLAISGSDTCETCIVPIPEIFDPVANRWDAMPTASLTTPYYPLMFVLPDGRVLEAGATRNATPTRVLDLNTKTWTTVDPVTRDGHSAVMYEPGKIMKSGSSADVSVSTAPASSTTFTLDMTQPSPQWQQTPDMAYARAYHNLTLLPDGSVLTVAGDSTLYGVDYANSVLNAELWSPATKTWRTLSAQKNGRLYHGTAVLLLDGRILVAGSGRVGPEPQFNGEIFSPPYLFKGPRPTISSTPASANYGASFFVGTPDAAGITSVTLLRISAATHSFNMDQRILRLNFSQTAGGLNVTAPANANLAPPGYYVMFALSAAGVPSMGAVIQIH